MAVPPVYFLFLKKKKKKNPSRLLGSPLVLNFQRKFKRKQPMMKTRKLLFSSQTKRLMSVWSKKMEASNLENEDVFPKNIQNEIIVIVD